MNSRLIDTAVTRCVAVAQSCQQALRRHPRRLSAALVSLLLAGGGGAYALARLAPDAADLPVHAVVEAVTPLQAEPAQAPVFNLYRSELTRSSDNTDTLLQRLGVDDAAAAVFLRGDAAARSALLGRAGRNVTAQTDERQQLLRLSARWSGESNTEFKRLVVERVGATWVSRLESAPLTASSRLASGTIQSSLFAATDEARIPDTVATQLAEIFSGDIDFHRALRKGDHFAVVYETLEGDGEPLRSGRVLSAEFVNNGKRFQAMWFADPSSTGKGAYYTLDGLSLQRAYLASPLQFSRVTSGFKMRVHPILQTLRAHQGVDYGAPSGTPVRVVGDGVVEFSGWQNGYGNIVIVKHRNQHSTVYAHLSRTQVRKGERVAQGQTIGAVGATGWATGPHLHFEFRVNGVFRDPLTVVRQQDSVPVSAAARPAFNQLASENRLALAAAATVGQASAQ